MGLINKKVCKLEWGWGQAVGPSRSDGGVGVRRYDGVGVVGQRLLAIERMSMSVHFKKRLGFCKWGWGCW